MELIGFTAIMSILLIYLYRCVLSTIVRGICAVWMKLPGKHNAKHSKVFIAVGLSFALIAPIVAITGAGNAVGMANIAAHLIFALFLWLGIDLEIAFFNKIVEKQ